MSTIFKKLNLSKKEIFRAQPSEVFYNLPYHQKVLHIGGHLGLEAKFYSNVVFVEPIPKYAQFLREQGFEVFEGAVCGDELFITSYDQASSVLVPADHKIVNTIKVKNYTLDDINDESFDMLVIDAQGSEMNILKSGRLTFKYIIVEASNIPRYSGSATKNEIETFLTNQNFKKIKEFQHKSHDIYDLLFERA